MYKNKKELPHHRLWIVYFCQRITINRVFLTSCFSSLSSMKMKIDSPLQQSNPSTTTYDQGLTQLKQLLFEFILQYINIPRKTKVNQFQWGLGNAWIHPFMLLTIWLEKTKLHGRYTVRQLIHMGLLLETILQTSITHSDFFSHLDEHFSSPVFTLSTCHLPAFFFVPQLHQNPYHMSIQNHLTPSHWTPWSTLTQVRDRQEYLQHLTELVHVWIDQRMGLLNPNHSLYGWSLETCDQLWRLAYKLWHSILKLSCCVRCLNETLPHVSAWKNKDLLYLMNKICERTHVLYPDLYVYGYIYVLFGVARHLRKRAMRMNTPLSLASIPEDSRCSFLPVHNPLHPFPRISSSPYKQKKRHPQPLMILPSNSMQID